MMMPTMEQSSYYGRTQTPKVSKFDGKGQFAPWLAQFQAISRANKWDDKDKAIRVVAALEGPAANLLAGMTPAQMDDFGCLISYATVMSHPGGSLHIRLS